MIYDHITRVCIGVTCASFVCSRALVAEKRIFENSSMLSSQHILSHTTGLFGHMTMYTVLTWAWLLSKVE